MIWRIAVALLLVLLACGRPADAAIAVAVHDSGSNTSNLTSYSTNSVTFTSGRLYVLFVATTRGGSVATPTVSGAGGTWMQQATRTTNNDNNRITVFTSDDASGTGALTIDYAGSQQTGTAWVLYEVTGHDGASNDGIVQAPTAADSGTSVSSGTLTFAAFGHADNRPLAAFTRNSDSGTDSFDGGTWMVTQVTHSAPDTSLAAGHVDSADTSVTNSWGVNDRWCAVGVEIKADVVGGGGVVPRRTLLGVGA